MQKLYFAIQLLQVICLGYGALTHSRYNQHLDVAGNGASMRLKRETSKSWRVGTFSECTTSCGGGLRVRSVQCLNEDGIIFDDDCSLNERPASYEFCNQIDCSTGISDSSLFPASDTYTFNSGDSTSVLKFDYIGAGIYGVQLNTTESDGSSTRLLQAVSLLGTATELSTTPASNMMGIVNSGGDSFFEVDDENILPLNNVERISIASGDSIGFQDNMIMLGSGDANTLLNVDTLRFFDGSRFYTFNSTDLVNPLNGPGILYYNPDTSQALFSTGSSLNEVLDDSIPSTPTDETEVTTTPASSSSTPDQTTTSATATTPTATSSPIPTTALPPSSTEDPTDACDDRPSRSRNAPHSRRTSHSRRGPHSRSPQFGSPHSRRTPHSRNSLNSNNAPSSSARSAPCGEEGRKSRRFKSHSRAHRGRQAGRGGHRPGGPGGPDAGPGGRGDGPSRQGDGPSRHGGSPSLQG